MSTVEHVLISDIFSDSRHRPREVHRSVSHRSFLVSVDLSFLLKYLHSIEPMPLTSNPTIVLEQITIDSILCSIDNCKTIYDVFCFHCRTNFCSNHFSQHEKQRSTSDEFQRDIDDLLALASSKSFSISSKKSNRKKLRRKFSNPFVSSKFLIEKMKENSEIPMKTIVGYNLRKRPRRHLKKLLRTTKKTLKTKFCQTFIKNRSTNEEKLCRRELPCPYHSS